MIKQKSSLKMENIKNYFNGGHLIECFCITPSINFNWMHKTTTTPMSWELNFSWFFWYISFGNVKVNLKKAGY